MLKLHNTLTHKTEAFTPIVSDSVSLYTCGPTVYDRPHVGNWASFIYWDILVRVLIASGYDVNRVMNITDVGHLVSDADDGQDKLEKGAAREGKTAWEVADYYTKDFIKGMEALGMIAPEHMVRATDFITQQLDLVRTLKEKGYTYQTRDGIYFDTSKFPTYADFAGLDLEAQKAGARVEQNPEKRAPWDFALWKFTPDGQTRDMQWETPSDLVELPSETPLMGFPGWHLECSAMAMSILGATIDIHTGGIDHIPVHHTNEIAQSEAASGQQFSRVWLHNNHIKIDGTKVSKSLGNTYTLQDIEEKGYSPMDLRMAIVQSHYRSEGTFTFENLAAAHNRLANWRNYAVLRHQTHDRLNDDDEKASKDTFTAATARLVDALQNDLDTPEAMRIIDETFSTLDNKKLESIYHHGLVSFLETIDELLGVQLLTSTPDLDDDMKQLIITRERARDEKDWEASDKLRDTLAKHGVMVSDRAGGSAWMYSDKRG